MKYDRNSRADRLPDFIIAGGMKCGTTSLHHILDSHPKIYIPKEEIHFFNFDDITQNTDTFVFVHGVWHYPDFSNNLDQHLDWYKSFFKKAERHQLIGEDSTTYLASDIAPKRISKDIPDVKIILMLRDPALRTYSHYWHLVRTGRALWNFENTLQFAPFDIIQRSLYKPQIERFLNFIPRDQIFFIVFEEFINDIPSALMELSDFLGQSFELFDLTNIKTHHNHASIPAIPEFQILINRLLHSNFRKQRAMNKNLNRTVSKKSQRNPLSIVAKIHRLINPLRKIKPPSMNSATKKFLNDFFSNKNRGLSETIDKDLGSFWYKP